MHVLSEETEQMRELRMFSQRNLSRCVMCASTPPTSTLMQVNKKRMTLIVQKNNAVMRYLLKLKITF